MTQEQENLNYILDKYKLSFEDCISLLKYIQEITYMRVDRIVDELDRIDSGGV